MAAIFFYNDAGRIGRKQFIQSGIQAIFGCVTLEAIAGNLLTCHALVLADELQNLGSRLVHLGHLRFIGCASKLPSGCLMVSFT